MKLHEYQSKAILAGHGVPIPRGKVAHTPAEARRHAEWLGVPAVVKAQILAGSRGKAGGIKLAPTPGEAERAATKILGTQINGMPVRKVLIDEAVTITKEVYVGITVDRTARSVIMLASPDGGVEIEETARVSPQSITRIPLDPELGLRDYQIRQIALALGLTRDLWRDFVPVARGLHSAFAACDASLAEINPLVLTKEGRLIGVDGKMVLDDNALFRHLDLAEMRDAEEEDELERRARDEDISYIKLDGEIGCMVNGAGLAMATMDMIELLGGAPANFLDIGGGARADKVASALRLLLTDIKVRAVLINVFGGITRCDEVAEGILAAKEEIGPTIPMVVRLVGTNEKEGQRMLDEAGMMTASSLSEAARKAIEVSRE